MNKRIVKVDLNIDGLRVVRISDATQHDKSTHFIGISFMDNVELAGYTLQVYYYIAFPATIPFCRYNSKSTKFNGNSYT